MKRVPFEPSWPSSGNACLCAWRSVRGLGVAVQVKICKIAWSCWRSSVFFDPSVNPVFGESIGDKFSFVCSPLRKSEIIDMISKASRFLKLLVLLILSARILLDQVGLRRLNSETVFFLGATSPVCMCCGCGGTVAKDPESWVQRGGRWSFNSGLLCISKFPAGKKTQTIYIITSYSPVVFWVWYLLLSNHATPVLTRKDVSPEKNTLNNIEKSIMSMAASRKTKGQQPAMAMLLRTKHWNMEALNECG